VVVRLGRKAELMACICTRIANRDEVAPQLSPTEKMREYKADT